MVLRGFTRKGATEPGIANPSHPFLLDSIRKGSMSQSDFIRLKKLSLWRPQPS